MALQNIVGAGLWIPQLEPWLSATQQIGSSDTATLDADEEEYQIIGAIHIDGGGSKTFGTSGSAIGWLAGASITFQATATLRVGVKKAASIDAANGPAARATIGAAAFDVYDDLVGGTDTISSTTWREDAMSAGTPFTVADGDLIAICFHLDITAAAQSIKIRQGLPVGTIAFPVYTLVTSGPTYTAQTHLSNVILTFDDGALGWIEPSHIWSTADVASGTIGNTNIFGNVFQVPFTCKIDAIAAQCSNADFALDLYSTPLATPGLIEAVTHDANRAAATGSRIYLRRLATPRTLTINTDYAIGVRQTSATAITVLQRDVSTAAYFKTSNMGAECYAANSAAGATFAAQNSGKRRYHIWARVCALDDGVSAGGGTNRAALPSGVSALG